jgi:5-oxopent-3-ene-1,2,5-tricarboxylate decarboxylase / 2-hydroxyhepta-2,4-diene-1,7-dioate isomerase
MFAGTAYGVVLNDQAEIARLGDGLSGDPYKAAPAAPVVYIKPRTCFAFGGAPVLLTEDVPTVTVAATLGLIFARDVSAHCANGLAAVGGACLALDVSVPHSSYYRPAIAERCRDGFLPLGAPAEVPPNLSSLELVTHVDGVSVHRWSLDRLVRSIPELISDLARFMTLRAGDMLLIGLPGDAPTACVGSQVEVSATGMPTLRANFKAEVLA